jgi:hypothetical protein
VKVKGAPPPWGCSVKSLFWDYSHVSRAQVAGTASQELREGNWCFSSLLLLTDDDCQRVHPDDLSALRSRYPQGWQLLCFRYGGQRGGYDVLEDGEWRMRVAGAVIEPIPDPQYHRGDRVFAEFKQAIGTVRDVVWHLKHQRVYYALEFAGELSGRWHFENELRPSGKD